MKLQDRVWKLPRHEDDEAAAEEGIGRILALSDGVFAIAITLLIIAIAIPATTSDAPVGGAAEALAPLPGLCPELSGDRQVLGDTSSGVPAHRPL